MNPIRGRQPARGWSVLAAMLLATALLLLVLMALAWSGLAQLGPAPFSVVIDGDTVFSGIDLANMPAGQQAALVGGLTLAVLLVVVMLPLTLFAVVALVLSVVLLSLGLPLLLVGGLFVLLLSPLWLMLLALGWLWRRSSRSDRPPRSATMAG